MSIPSRPSPHARLRILAAGRGCAVLSLFAVPLNKPATTVLLALALLGSLLGADLPRRWRAAWREPVVRGFLVWFAVLSASALHAWADTGVSALRGSYLWACLFPLLVATLLEDARWRWRALAAYAAAVGLVILVSYAMHWGLVPQRDVVDRVPAMRNTVFKEYTKQGLASLIVLSMALALAGHAASRRWRIALLAAAAAILCNVVLLIESRTTYVALLPLLGYWSWRLMRRRLSGWRTLLASATLTLVTVVALWSAPPVRERLVEAIGSEAERYLADGEPTSTGIRLRLWSETLSIAAEAPLFGHGLYRWEPVYAQRMRAVPDAEPFIMGHPHQEMLLVLAEQGLVGLLVFLGLIAALAVRIHRLPDPQRAIFASIVLIYLTAGLAHGLWADYTHRLTFILLLACIPARPPPRPGARDDAAR